MRKVFLVFITLLLSGCTAEQIEKLHDDGSAPPGSPPGYYNYKEAQKWEAENNIGLAEDSYCNAAKLGHPDAIDPCVKYAFLYARQSPLKICDAAPYDEEAKVLCRSWAPTQAGQERFHEALSAITEKKLQAAFIKENIKANKYDLQLEDF